MREEDGIFSYYSVILREKGILTQLWDFEGICVNIEIWGA